MRCGGSRDGEALVVLGSIAAALLVWLLWGCTIHLHMSERYTVASPTTQPADDNALTAEYLAKRLLGLGGGE